MGQNIAWRLTRATRARFYELIGEREIASDYDDAWYAATEDIKSLPGYPVGVNEHEDLIHLVLIDTWH